MEALSSTEIFLFEGFRLDRRGPFRRDENAALTPVEIGSRAFDVLHVLLDRPGRLLSRKEIMAAAWPGTVVEDNNLNVQIGPCAARSIATARGVAASRPSPGAATVLSRR